MLSVFIGTQEKNVFLENTVIKKHLKAAILGAIILKNFVYNSC